MVNTKDPKEHGEEEREEVIGVEVESPAVDKEGGHNGNTRPTKDASVHVVIDDKFNQFQSNTAPTGPATAVENDVESIPTQVARGANMALPLPGAVAVEGGPPPPPPLALPGAVAVEGPPPQTTASGTTPEAEVASNIQGGTNIHDLPPPSLDTSRSLAVANLVEEGILQDAVPQEQSVLPTSSSSIQRNQSNKRMITTFFGWVLCIVVLVVVLVAVIASDGNNEPADNINIDDPITATESPAQPNLLTEDKVLSLLPETTVDKINDQLDSPQSQAFQWLLADALFPYLTEYQAKQRFILATLYYATNGDEWTSNDGWLDYNSHECNWWQKSDFSGMTVMETIFPLYLSTMFPPDNTLPKPCNETNGAVQHLWLAKNNLQGTLPDELYLLTSLKTLSLGDEDPMLQGRMSTHIGHMTNLEGLSFEYIESNGGTIPSETGLLTNLRAFMYRGSGLVGTIPAEMWANTQMEHFELGRNADLHGTIPSAIGNWTKVQWIAWEFNFISGTIPSEFGGMESLQWITSQGNSLTGQIPSELGRLSKVGLLAMNFNDFTGTIPTELGLLNDCFFLHLAYAQLSGTLPSELGLLTNLNVSIDLQDNELLSGTIPTELGLLSSLAKLELSGNSLTGQIPSELGQLKTGALNFANNSLSGTIPQELVAIEPYLYRMWLQGNPLLSGTIPSEFCGMNKSCVDFVINRCRDPQGLSFDCTNSLCGCDCPCAV